MSDILIIGVNITHQIKEILDSSIYKKQIHYIPSTEYQFRDVIFVQRKKYLPAIEHQEITNEGHLVPINNDLKIYASVIDINTAENKSIKDKWYLQNDSSNLDLKVQLTISFLAVIHWKTNREIIQINVESKFKEQGIQNDINDVEPLSNDEIKNSLN